MHFITKLKRTNNNVTVLQYKQPTNSFQGFPDIYPKVSDCETPSTVAPCLPYGGCPPHQGASNVPQPRPLCPGCHSKETC